MRRRECLLGLGALGALGHVRAGDHLASMQWSTGNSRLLPLAAHRGRVLFVGDQSLGVLAPDTGTMLWSSRHEFPSEASFKVRASSNILIAGCADQIAAWDFQTGKRRWSHSANIQLGVPCVTADRTLLCDGNILKCLGNSDGNLLWRFPFTPETLGAYAPVVSGQRVWLAPGDGVLYSLDLATGALLSRIDRSTEWQYLRQMQVEGPFLVAGSYKELLFGMSASTGRVIWTFNAGNFINSQLVANGRAFLWSPTGWIFAIAVKDGRLLWRHQTTQYRLGQPAWAAVMAELVVSGSSLFALDMDDTLHVLDVRDGVETSRFTFPEPLVPTVLPLNRGNVMLATESGNLQLIKVG